MNPDQNNPKQPPKAVPQDVNKFMPPAPGDVVHQPHEQFEEQPETQQAPTRQPAGKFDVDDQIVRKKKQARQLFALTSVFAVLVLVGVAIIAISLSSGGDELSGDELPIDEQLMNDVNTLGLGVINFRNGSNNFEITPEKVAMLNLSYIPNDFSDPRTGNAYELTTAIPEVGQLQYVIGGVCNEDDSISQSGKEDQFALRALLETGKLYCLEKSEVTQVTTPTP